MSAVIRYFSAVCVLSHRGSMSDSPQGLSPLFHPRGKHLNWACVCSVSSWIYGSCVKAIGVALNQAIYSENRRCNHTERCLRSAPLARNQKSREPRCTQGEMGVAHPGRLGRDTGSDASCVQTLVLQHLLLCPNTLRQVGGNALSQRCWL